MTNNSRAKRAQRSNKLARNVPVAQRKARGLRVAAGAGAYRQRTVVPL